MAATLDPKQSRGVRELLPWLFLTGESQKQVVCKDSSILGCWQMEGVDIEAHATLDVAATQFDALLRRLNEVGCSVWTTLSRRPAARYVRGTFDNPVADYIDEKWGETFATHPVYVNKVFLAVTMPTAHGALSIGEMVGDNLGLGDKLPKAIVKALKSRLSRKDALGFRTEDELAVASRRFETDVAGVVDRALHDIRVQRLTGATLLGYLKSTVSVNPLAAVQPVVDEYLDAFLPDTFIDNTAQPYLVLDGVKRKYVGVFSLKDAPPGNVLQCLNLLSAMSVEMRVNAVWRSASRAKAEHFLSAARTFDEMRGLTPRKLIKSVMAQGEGMLDADDTPTTRVGALAEEFRQMQRRREAFFGWISVSVVVLADSPELLEEQMERTARSLEQTGLVFIRERDGSLSGFCVGIPGHVKEVVRWHFVEAANATDVMPLISLDSGLPYHPFFSQGYPTPLPPNATLRTRYNTVQYFNYHFGELGHTLIVGPAGNGKTMMQMFLTAQFLKYPNARVFILDKDLSCKAPTLLMDGVHVDLDPAHAGNVELNPLSIAKDDSGRAWLVGWLDRLLAARGDRLTDTQLEEVSGAIARVAPDPEARLSTLQAQLPEDLRARLAPWCEGGAYGMYFDHPRDNFTFATITCTEVGSLVAAGLHDVVRAYTDYAFFRIDKFLSGRTLAEVGPTMIYFEEAGFLLGSPLFAERARDYLMTLRKKRAHLVMTAQSPEPFVRDPQLGAAIRDNVATVIFLPNSMAVGASLAKQYKTAFGVTDTQLSLIAGASPKIEYCMFQLQAGAFRVCQARFPPAIVACLRSDVKSQAVFDRYYDPEDPEWKDKYLDAVVNA